MKVIKVEKNSYLFDVVIDLLVKHYDVKNRGQEYWIKRFSKLEPSYVGYLLDIDSKYVGFIGVISSEAIFGLSVWYVRESYRNYSVAFMLKAIDDIGNAPIVNSSPNPTALKVFKRIKGFRCNEEFVGLPKRIFGYSNSAEDTLYRGNKYNVVYDKKVSLIDLVVISVKYKKICLALLGSEPEMLISKKINVLYKNISYKFPLSIYGDIYE